MKKVFLLVVCAGILVPLVWVLIYKFEGAVPEVDIRMPSLSLYRCLVTVWTATLRW